MGKDWKKFDELIYLSFSEGHAKDLETIVFKEKEYRKNLPTFLGADSNLNVKLLKKYECDEKKGNKKKASMFGSELLKPQLIND